MTHPFDLWYEDHGSDYPEIGEAFGAWLAEQTGQTIVGGPAGEPPTFVAIPEGNDEDRD